MDLRSSSITADILNILSDGKVHTSQEIASELEIHKNTVQRHIQSLAYRYPIETFHGGDKKGGIFLDKKYIHDGRIWSKDELQVIEKALGLLQKSDCKDYDQKILTSLIQEFRPPA